MIAVISMGEWVFVVALVLIFAVGFVAIRRKKTGEVFGAGDGSSCVGMGGAAGDGGDCGGDGGGDGGGGGE